ncbi:MAG TPA: hypothetical protein ENJ35_00445 [Gammaproteobacteria bacterium]|nr:hypothetical protein [Gammaproteobacteria bacterium]
MNVTLRKTTQVTLFGLGAVLALTACNDTNNSDSAGVAGDSKEQKAVVATVAADFSSGAHAVFSTEAPFSGVTQQSPTVSDITVNCNGEYFYRIERFSGENVTRFHISKPAEVLTQFSTRDSSGQETSSSNPQGMVFVSDTRAYLLRYGSNKAWIVNPSAKTDAEFKTGELDLSAYSVDGSPNMSDGVIVDGKLYIALQRLDKSFAPQDAYVAVFDTTTDQEIDTNPDKAGLKGILLPVKNPGDIEYSSATGKIYVQGTGRYGSSFSGRDPEYTGGIAVIDPAGKYETAMVLDDGDAASHPAGLFTGMEIVSATRGYVVGYTGFNDNSLFSFNPATGKLDVDANGKPVPVADIKGVGIGGLATDNKGELWVSIADNTAPGIKVLNGADGKVIKDRIATTLNPTAIAFCDAPGK